MAQNLYKHTQNAQEYQGDKAQFKLRYPIAFSLF